MGDGQSSRPGNFGSYHDHQPFNAIKPGNLAQVAPGFKVSVRQLIILAHTEWPGAVKYSDASDYCGPGMNTGLLQFYQ